MTPLVTIATHLFYTIVQKHRVHRAAINFGIAIVLEGPITQCITLTFKIHPVAEIFSYLDAVL